MFKESWELPITLKGTIIDIETVGFRRKVQIITLGWVSGNRLQVYQSENDSEEERQRMKNAVKELKYLPSPYIGYDVSRKTLILNLKFDLDMLEKENCKYLKSLEFLPYSKEIVENTLGEEEISGRMENKTWLLWKEFSRKKDNKILEVLMYHNANNILRILFLYTKHNIILSSFSQSI